MNEKTLRTLEYNKILTALEDRAVSDGAKKLCRNLTPMTDINEINTAQEHTSFALSRLFRKGNISFAGVKDISGLLKHVAIGGTLNAAELLSVSSLLSAAQRVKQYAKKERENEPSDSLDAYFDIIEPLPLLNKEISRCILSENEISDDASSNLKSIRRSIKQTNDKIHSSVSSLLNKSDLQSYLQDSIITIRNDRYCIPVKAEYKNNVPGMIHDQSASGQTVYIEPMAIVQLNNSLKEHLIEEAKEIEVILAGLSAQVGEHIDEIMDNIKTLITLDFIFAKAKLAQDQNASKPILNSNRIINIKKARHPLLDSKKAVPIDIRLGEEFNLLIITGPNTGGKTVSLKTLGLLTIMSQAGLHIPAADNSQMAIFEEIYADIGDEQSIEQNLSTFSAHMTNTVSILENADSNSLCLFDELGAGTDPTEGAALAISILTFLHNRDIRTVATTHYSEIKIFALSTPGVENGSCEFDVETLSPTYRLLIGIPGKSNAFAISKKLGLSDDIIEDAKQHIGEQTRNFEELLADIEINRKTIENDQAEIERHKLEIKKLREALEKKQTNIDERRQKIIDEANEQARTILREAKEFADKTISDINKGKTSNASLKDMEKIRTAAGDKLKSVKSNNDKAKQPKVNNKASDFKKGDSVKVLSMNLKGTIIEPPNKSGMATVKMGVLTSNVHINDLMLVDEVTVSAKGFSKTGSGKIKMSKSLNVSNEVNLIGKTVDEALSVLDKYLDDAYLAHLNTVRVVHGRGTGALRNAVHNHLKKQKYVKSYRLGEFGEGDTGVTIVEFTN